MLFRRWTDISAWNTSHTAVWVVLALAFVVLGAVLWIGYRSPGPPVRRGDEDHPHGDW